jgi:hypothetical protein
MTYDKHEEVSDSNPYPVSAQVGKTTVVDVTLSLNTGPYASGEVLADTQVVAGASRVIDFGGIIQSIAVIDKDDQGAAMDIYIQDANVSMGTENSTPSISDANAASIVPGGIIAVATSDYKDLGGVKVAAIRGLSIPFKPATGTTSLYISAVNGTGTPTYTASGIVVRLGILQD